MKHITAVLIFFLFTSIAFCQTSDAFLKQLNQINKIISNWIDSDFEDVLPEQIFEQLAVDSSDSPHLFGLYQTAKTEYAEGLSRISELEHASAPMPAQDLAREFVSNKNQAAKKYIGKPYLLSGTVDAVRTDVQQNTILILFPNVKCIFPPSNAVEAALASTGDDISLQGTLEGFSTKGNVITIIITNCSILYKPDVSEQVESVNQAVYDFARVFQENISDEIDRVKGDLVETYYMNGKRLFAEHQYNAAIAEFQKIFIYRIDYKDVKNVITEIRTTIQYETADSIYRSGNKYLAYRSFIPLAFKLNFKNSAELFWKAFSEYFTGKISQAKANNALNDYLSVFDSLMKYIEYDKSRSEKLYGEWQPGFISFAKNYYKRDYQNYFLISEGRYLKARIGTPVDIECFLIYPQQLDNNFSRAFFLSKNLSLPKEFPLTFTKNYQEINRSDIGNWLGLRLIRQDEMEYIQVDGWLSAAERSRFSPSWKNYSFDPNQYPYCISLSELRALPEYQKLMQTNTVKAEALAQRVKTEKEYAYEIGKVVELKRLYIAPLFGSVTSWIDWIQGGDMKGYPLDSSRFYAIQHDINGGLFIGINLSNTIYDQAHVFNGIGFAVTYHKSIYVSQIKFLRGKGEITVDTFKLDGISVEFQYRYRGYSSVNGLIGIGFSNFEGQYSLKSGVRKYTWKEPIQLATATFGFGFGSENFRVQLYAQAYFSLKNAGLFSWREKSLNGSLSGGVSFEIPIKLLRYEEDVY